MQPSWLVDFLAGLMVLTSLYCLARLLAARVWKRSLHRDTNIAHMADAVAMAGMLVGGLRTLPDAAWEVIFGFFTLWFAVRAGRSVTRNAIKANGGTLVSHYLSHLTMAGAMLYMFLESSPSGVARATAVMSAMGGGGRSNLTGLTLLFVLLLFGSAVWHADSLTMYTTSRRLVAAGAPVAGAAPSRILRSVLRSVGRWPLVRRRPHRRDDQRATSPLGAAPGDGLSHRPLRHHGLHVDNPPLNSVPLSSCVGIGGLASWPWVGRGAA